MALCQFISALVLAASLVKTGGASASLKEIVPSIELARERGPAIFNAVNDAMRQWGSSLHHNGMSVFLASVPKNVLLHHGNDREAAPSGPDWLAYEIEHAEEFARSWNRNSGGQPSDLESFSSRNGDKHDQDSSQKPVLGRSAASEDASRDASEDATEHGWLHVYRATRPLHYLYIDGMSGAKTEMGTLDSQDLLLRNNSSDDDDDDDDGSGFMGELQRAADLCALVQPWGLQGVIRMEAGFEIIQCDFSDGLEQVQALQRAAPGSYDDDDKDDGDGHGLRGLEFLRGLSERYHGIGGRRTVVDYASMVSAFFFPVNLTNPDIGRPDLPRLVSTDAATLAAIRRYLERAIKDRHSRISTDGANWQEWQDWQGITDLVVGRYADRLLYMADEIDSPERMALEVGFLLDVYIDYRGRNDSDGRDSIDVPAAIDRCTHYYLRTTVTAAATTDRLIHVALTAVTGEICTALFHVRDLVSVRRPHGDAERTAALTASVQTLRSLMAHLGWARFKRCPPCGLGEVCMVPMWPMGTVEQYRTPSCFNGTDSSGSENYWGEWGS